MKVDKTKFKKGAASFYIVAFSTLILVIVAASFASAIISEITRTANEDLSQSAYDSALAGVEDAKLALANYQKCLEAGQTTEVAPNDNGEVTCGNIIYWMEHPDCDMVGHILGRIEKNASGEVKVNDSGNDPNATDYNQAYTCVKIETNLTDYRASLSQNYQSRMVRLKFDNGVSANDIKAFKISWYSNRDGGMPNYLNYVNNRVAFQSLISTSVAVPPTISVQITQTANEFNLSSFNEVNVGEKWTNRATLFLVPAENASNNDGNYGVLVENNKIGASYVVSTNDGTTKNLPFVINCGGENSLSNEYACSALIELPKPIGGNRSDDTFMINVSLPYGQPETDFSLEFCKDAENCSIVNLEGGENSSLATLGSLQIGVDSTGRANDLYRRVEVRLERTDTSFTNLVYPFEITGSGSGGVAPLQKNLEVTVERGL